VETTFEIPSDRKSSLDMFRALIDARTAEVSGLYAKAKARLDECNAEADQRLLVLYRECGGEELPEGAVITAGPEGYSLTIKTPDVAAPKVLPQQPAKKKAPKRRRAKKKATKKARSS